MVIVVVCTVLSDCVGIEEEVEDESVASVVEKAFDGVIVDDDTAGGSVIKDDDTGGFNDDGSGVEVDIFSVVSVVVDNNVVVVVGLGAHLLILSQSHGAEQSVKQF